MLTGQPLKRISSALLCIIKRFHLKLAKQFLFRIREAKTYIARAPLGFQVKYKGETISHKNSHPMTKNHRMTKINFKNRY